MPRVHVRAKPDRAILQLYYVDPVTGRDVTKSAKTADWKEAERAAANWERELESGLFARTLSWEQLRKRFEDEYYPQCSTPSQRPLRAAIKHFERVVGQPRDVTAIDAQLLNRFSSTLRKEGMKDTTIGKQLRHLRALFNWAAKVGYIKAAPRFLMPRTKGKASKGRAITEAEYNSMLALATPPWKRFIEALWLSGLRLEEAMRLSWDDPPVRLDLTGKFPAIYFSAAGQKNREDTISPITPEFATFLGARGKGLALPVGVTVWTASKEISAIGKAAKIVVNEDGKFASAHDLRRSFATRWALKVPPLVLKSLMRHANIQTTLSYYAEVNANDVSAMLSVPPTVLPAEKK